MTAVNSTNLHWAWVESETGTVFDRMSITQITDFDENPYWVLSEDLPVEMGGGSVDDVGVETYSTFEYTKNVFMSKPGLIFVITVFCIMFLLVVRTLLSYSSRTCARSEIYTKLSPTHDLFVTTMEDESKDDKSYREIL